MWRNKGVHMNRLRIMIWHDRDSFLLVLRRCDECWKFKMWISRVNRAYRLQSMCTLSISTFSALGVSHVYTCSLNLLIYLYLYRLCIIVYVQSAYQWSNHRDLIDESLRLVARLENRRYKTKLCTSVSWITCSGKSVFLLVLSCPDIHREGHYEMTRGVCLSVCLSFTFTSASREVPPISVSCLSMTALIGLVTLTFDLLTSKYVHGLFVWCAYIVPILGFLGLFVLELVKARDRQSDGQTPRVIL